MGPRADSPAGLARRRASFGRNAPSRSGALPALPAVFARIAAVAWPAAPVRMSTLVFRSFLVLSAAIVLIDALPLFAGPAAAGTLGFDPTAHPRESPRYSAGVRDSLFLLRVEERRLAADYAGAARLAREFLAMRRADPGERPYQIENAEALVRMMDRVAALPREAQREFARGDSLDRVVPDWASDAPPGVGSGLARRRLDIMLRHVNNDFPEVLDRQLRLGGHLYREGDYQGAEQLGRDALALARRALSPGHPLTATAMQLVGICLVHQGDFAGAEPYYRASLPILEAASESAHMVRDHQFLATLITAVHTTAMLLYERGDPVAAEAYERWVVDSIRPAMEGLPLKDQSCLGGYCIWRQRMLLAAGDTLQAETLAREHLAVNRRRIAGLGIEFVRSHGGHDWVNALNSLADIVLARGRVDEGLLLRREALDAARLVQGEKHPQVAACEAGVGAALARAGDFAGARKHLQRALAMHREILGREHLEACRDLHALGELALREGDAARAEALLVEAVAIYDAARLRSGEGLTRATFRLASPYTALAAARLLRGRHDEAWPAAQLAQSRCLLELLDESRPRGLQSGAMARKVQTAPSAQAIPVAREAPAAQAVPRVKVSTLAEIQAAIPANCAIVGWVEHRPSALGTGEGAGSLWGYVLRRNGPVRWVRLIPGNAATRFQTALRAVSSWSLRVALDEEIERAARDAWRERVAPLAEHLVGVTRLCVVPSGAMLGVPVEAMVEESGGSLADRYTISYAPSASIWASLAARGGGEATRRPALLVGDPVFTRPSPAPDVAPVVATIAAGAALGPEVLYRSAVAGNREALDRLPALPCTRDEVLGAAGVLGEARTLLGADASEEALLALAAAGELRRFGILHFATHALVDDRQPAHSALVLSRAHLAGDLANVEAGGRMTDGLLTAEEICRDWSLDADLVTLSGCQTALGREAAGEGYLGFAHAFFQAGARRLLVSLWKVDDEATSLLMRRFYENLAKTGAGRSDGATMGGANAAGALGEKAPTNTAGGDAAEALREAKRWLRERRDERGALPFAHPAYWSAFVLVGGA